MNEDQEPKQETIQKEIFPVINDIIIKLGVLAQEYSRAAKEVENLQKALELEKAARNKSEELLKETINKLEQEVKDMEKEMNILPRFRDKSA